MKSRIKYSCALNEISISNEGGKIVLLYKVSLPVFRPEGLRLCEDL